jgi:hypothetical protein
MFLIGAFEITGPFLPAWQLADLSESKYSRQADEALST